MRHLLQKSLSAIVLCAAALAQSLTGTVIDTNGVGIPGVSVTLNNAGGTQITDAVGAFNFPLLQNRQYTVTIVAPTTTHAPRQLSFRVNGVSSMGNVVLQPACRVFGVVLGPNGLPLANANLDAADVNGNTYYTPLDSTDAAGLFSVTVPLGQTRIRMNPPAGQTLIRFETNVLLTADLDLGVIHMPQAFTVTGVVVDAVSSLGAGSVTISTFDNITGEEILQSTPTTNSLGAFTLQLPIGAWRIELDPPLTGALRCPRVIHGLPVFGNTSLGLVTLQPGIMLTGTVTDTNAAPVVDCDIDVLTADEFKLFTLHDNTDATGTYRVVVPAGTYRIRVDPKPTTGLYGVRTAVATYAAASTVPPITLQPGVLVQAAIIGPQGFEANADLDFFDPVTGEFIVIEGDKSDSNGIMNAIVPTGLFDIALDAVQGSTAAPIRLQAFIPGPLQTPVYLAQKAAVIDVHNTYGILTIGQGGSLFVEGRLRHLSGADLPTTLALSIRFPSGQEQPVAQLPLVLPNGVDFSTGQLTLPMPAVPTTELKRELRFFARLLDQNQAILDQAYVEFVVQ